MDKEIAIGVHVPCVTGAQPSICPDGLGGSLGTVPVSGHDDRPADLDFADFADGDLVAVLIGDACLQRGPRTPAGAQQFSLVIAGRERRARAGGFGHAVELDEAAAEGLCRLGQYGFGDR